MVMLVSGSINKVKELSGQGAADLGIILTPNNPNSIDAVVATGLPFVVDNGAFSGFNADKFMRLIDKVCRNAKSHLLWVVCPDVVGNAEATLAHWPWWSAQIRARNLPVAFVLQDGQEAFKLPEADAYFIGGSTKWKLSAHAAELAGEVKKRGKWLHVGRVNSLRRLRVALDMGADSTDGSSLSKFGDKYLHTFCRWSKHLHEQPTLFV